MIDVDDWGGGGGAVVVAGGRVRKATQLPFVQEGQHPGYIFGDGSPGNSKTVPYMHAVWAPLPGQVNRN